MTKKENMGPYQKYKNLKECSERMRSGPVWQPIKTKKYLEERYSFPQAYALLLCGALQEYNSGQLSCEEIKKELSLEGTGLSALVQKAYGAPMEDFENKKRGGSFILAEEYQLLDQGKETGPIQAEHPLEKAYIHQKVVEYTSEYINSEIKLAPRSKDVRDYLMSLSIMKDNIVTMSKNSGKGIDRYKECAVVYKKLDGNYKSLRAGKFYELHLKPVKEYIDLSFDTFFARLMKGEISFQDIKEESVNQKSKLYKLWEDYTKACGIDKNAFPSPFFYYN